MRRGVLIAVLALAGLMMLPSAGASARVKQRFFHTLDGNISCAMLPDKKARRKHHRKIPGFPGVARCDIQAHSWVAPPKPKWCPVDWGFGVEVTRKKGGRYVCAGDSVISLKSPALSPGATRRVGRYACQVLETGVRCTNDRTAHGFELSADAVSLF
ncbi:MAG: DUF6636 domain-containing protein [Solirubrobacterales bacterium]